METRAATIGNADPETEPVPRPRGLPEEAARQQHRVVTVRMVGGAMVAGWEERAEQPQNPRKCMWVMLLMSSLMVLRVRPDGPSTVGPRPFGEPDLSGPMPWDTAPLVGMNDTFEATFLAPQMERASTFMQAAGWDNNRMTISGLGKAIEIGDGARGGAAVSMPPGVSAVILDAGRWIQGACPQKPGAAASTCYVAVGRVPSGRNLRAAAGAAPRSCFQFLCGASLASLVPASLATKAPPPALGGKEPVLAPTDADRACVNAESIRTAAPGVDNRSAVLSWDPPRGEHAAGLGTCLSVVLYPTMAAVVTRAIPRSPAVLFDGKTGSVVAASYRGVPGKEHVVVHQFDAQTLKFRRTYILQWVQVAWLLHAPRVSDGFLFLVGWDPPLIGATWIIDLASGELKLQEPPAAGGRVSRRRSLPGVVVQTASESPEEVEGACVISPQA